MIVLLVGYEMTGKKCLDVLKIERGLREASN